MLVNCVPPGFLLQSGSFHAKNQKREKEAGFGPAFVYLFFFLLVQ